jgi:hypothetical protein
MKNLPTNSILFHGLVENLLISNWMVFSVEKEINIVYASATESEFKGEKVLLFLLKHELVEFLLETGRGRKVCMSTFRRVHFVLVHIV